MEELGFFQKNLARLRWALTPVSTKEKHLEEIKNILRQWPETAALLQMAEDKKIPIGFDTKMIGGKTTGGFIRSTKAGKTRIRLQPLRPAGQVAATLVHELRHMWQMDVLGIGANDFRGEYGRPQTKLMTTRIKEADAYAFTHMIATRIKRMGDDLEEAAKMATNLAALNPTKSLTQQNIDAINKHFQEKTKTYAAQDVQNIRDRFLEELQDLDSYDRSGLRKYHALYTTPHFEAKPKTPDDTGKYELQSLRRILRAGVTPDAPDYMAGVSDFDLSRKVMQPIQPDILKTMRLMRVFEKAAAKGKLDEEASLQKRKTIAQHVDAVMAARRKKSLEKPQF